MPRFLTFVCFKPITRLMETDVKSITLGCRLNAYESEVMASHAKAQGLKDAVIINTCAVTNEAVRRGRQTIRRAVRENVGSKIIVTGCAAQIQPQEFAKIDGVTHVIGNGEKMQARSFALKTKTNVSDIMKTGHVNSSRAQVAAQPAPTQKSRAIVQIQNGCDHRCTFCIIPYGRGNSRSVSASDIVSQITILSAQGFNEVVLTGVDISSWGDDLAEKPLLGNLVARILKSVPDLPRLRLSSIDSAEVDDELFALFAREPRLTPYLHLSLQHGDNMILKRMKRRHNRDDAISLCQRLRKVRPDMSFGADIIAGFPTETEAMFENSLALVKECGLAWLHVFPYSARTGTPAAKMPQVSGSVIKDRAKRLREAGDQSRISFLKSRSFGYDLALIEKGGLARLADFSPIKLPAHSLPTGSLQAVQITGYDTTSLLGEFA